MYINKYRT